MSIRQTNQTIKLLPVEELHPNGYQRKTNPAQVERIAAAFDEAKLGLIIVSERGGKYHLLDGAHRAAALRKLGYTHAMCIVLSGLDYAQEAEFFRTQNQNVRPLTKYNLFKAGLEAGDRVCVRIDETCRANGFVVSMSSRGFNNMSAIYALSTIAAVYGYEVLGTTLRLIRATWEGVSNATRREFLVGTAEFVHRFGEADFARRMSMKGIAQIWQDYLAETSHAVRATDAPEMRIAFCRVLVRHYNKGLGAASKARLHMEERS